MKTRGMSTHSVWNVRCAALLLIILGGCMETGEQAALGSDNNLKRAEAAILLH